MHSKVSELNVSAPHAAREGIEGAVVNTPTSTTPHTALPTQTAAHGPIDRRRGWLEQDLPREPDHQLGHERFQPQPSTSISSSKNPWASYAGRGPDPLPDPWPTPAAATLPTQQPQQPSSMTTTMQQQLPTPHHSNDPNKINSPLPDMRARADFLEPRPGGPGQLPDRSWWNSDPKEWGAAQPEGA